MKPKPVFMLVTVLQEDLGDFEKELEKKFPKVEIAGQLKKNPGSINARYDYILSVSSMYGCRQIAKELRCITPTKGQTRKLNETERFYDEETDTPIEIYYSAMYCGPEGGISRGYF